MRTRLVGLAAVLAASVALAGCGGGGGGTSPADAYRNQADAICTAAQRDLAKIAQPTTPSQVAPYLSQALATVGPSLDKLKALTPPAALKALHAKWVHLQDVQRQALRTLAGRISSGGNPETVYRAGAPAINARTTQINATAKQIGFKVCGKTAG